jgi:alternate signal-mediated exported protein
MNKLTKGAIATAAGVILLMGGAGTLASWNSSADAGSSQTVSSGQLSVTADAAGVWKSGSTVIDPSTFLIVPGDTLTYTQDFDLAASGDNLVFTLAATPGAIAASSTSAADVALAGALSSAPTTFSVAGSNISEVVPGSYEVVTSGTTTVTVTMTITFDSNSGNDTQLGSVTFGDGAVTVTQTA